MADLATAKDLADWLSTSFTAEESEAAAGLLDALEDALERRTGQTFTTGGQRTETHSGRGTRSVRLREPVSDLTAAGSVLKVGADPADPDWTVDLTDPANAVRDPDSPKRIWLRESTIPAGVGNVHVTYEAADYLPDIARQAVLDVAASVWRRRGGAQGVRSLRLGTEFSVTFEEARADSSAWQEATATLTEAVLG